MSDDSPAVQALHHLKAIRDVQHQQAQVDAELQDAFNGVTARIDAALPAIAQLQAQVRQLQGMLLDLAEDLKIVTSGDESLYWTANRIQGELQIAIEATPPTQD
jgi:small-conductance mechanosensitive channel